MAHPTGEKLRCEECGAEIVYTKACNCPATDTRKHADICCGKEMRVIGVEARPESGPRP